MLVSYQKMNLTLKDQQFVRVYHPMSLSPRESDFDMGLHIHQHVITKTSKGKKYFYYCLTEKYLRKQNSTKKFLMERNEKLTGIINIKVFKNIYISR